MLNFLISYKSQIICIILGIVIKDLYKFIKNKITRLPKEYKWQPPNPITNNESKKDVKNYPSDLKLNFQNNTIDFENLVSGKDAFLQGIILYCHIDKKENEEMRGVDFGNEFAKTIFDVKDNVEFQRQSEQLANNIINKQAFKLYIEKIYSIYRKKDVLYIEMKLCGIPETVTCKIPKNTFVIH